MIPNRVYDWLKWTAIVCLPAFSSFILIISKIYGWPDLGIQIAETLTATATLLGALLGISAIQYGKGDGEK